MIALAIAAGLLSAAAMLAGSYAVWLGTAPRRTTDVPVAAAWPPVLIVVPVHDEAPLIERKLANLATLDYPAGRRHVVVVDGGSTDGTVGRVSRWIAGRRGFDLLRTTHRNKTAQLNEALRVHPEQPWVLVTDADALLAPDVLRRLVAVASADPAVGVVGSRVRPASAHPIEMLHWRCTEWVREREYRRAASSGIVAAPCYLAERSLLADLPPDTVADDVHVACRAMVAGRRVAHSAALALELRSPRTHGALLRHKHRKADAYLREVFRFLPQAGAIPSPARQVFLWRAALLVAAPPLLVLAAVWIAAGLMAAAPALGADVAALVLIGSLVPMTARRGRDAARLVWLGALLSGITAAALARYPFSRQGASFPKILQPWEYRLPEEPR